MSSVMLVSPSTLLWTLHQLLPLPGALYSQNAVPQSKLILQLTDWFLVHSLFPFYSIPKVVIGWGKEWAGICHTGHWSGWGIKQAWCYNSSFFVICDSQKSAAMAAENSECSRASIPGLSPSTILSALTYPFPSVYFCPQHQHLRVPELIEIVPHSPSVFICVSLSCLTFSHFALSCLKREKKGVISLLLFLPPPY